MNLRRSVRFGSGRRLAVALSIALSFAEAAAAQEGWAARTARPTPTGGPASAPPGWIAFCADRRGECASATAAEPDVVALSPSRAAELERVNRAVNAGVRSMTDREAFGVVDLWTYPVDRGDCEDFVLLKRRRLIEAGWPRGALLVTVVREPRGAGHALLTVVTDRGDYVLDNNTDSIRPWFDTRYRFVKRQSQADPNRWVALGAE